MAKKPKPTDDEIDAAFNAATAEFDDDESTEFLLTITADRCGVSYGDVVSALAAKARREAKRSGPERVR